MPNNNTNNINDDPLDLWFDTISAEKSGEPNDWASPMSLSSLPDFIKEGYNNSITGLAQQITTGKQAFKICPLLNISKNAGDIARSKI